MIAAGKKLPMSKPEKAIAVVTGKRGERLEIR